MDNLDIAIFTMMMTLVIMHCAFGFAALTSKIDIGLDQKILWCALSLVTGPIGYYAYQGRIPCEILIGK